MKKRLLKAGALILCIMMCLCGTVSTFAAWTPLLPADQKQAKIEIDVTVDGEVTTNMHATAFRIIKVNVEDVNKDDPSKPEFNQPADPVYTWAPGVAKWVAAKYPAYIETTNSNAVAEAYTKWYNEDGSPAEEIVPFIDALAAAIKSHDSLIEFPYTADGFIEGTDPLVQSAVFGEDKKATIQNLSKGSYIVLIEGGNEIYQPSVANLTPIWRETEGDQPAGWYVNSPAILKLKHTGVSLVKTVSRQEAGPYGEAVSAGIGDNVYFNILADVPQYSENAISDTFKVRDEAAVGLQFTDALTVYGVKGTEKTPLTKGTDYTMTTTGATETVSGTFTLDFKYANVKTYDDVLITYRTLVTDKAVVGPAGNPNTAHMDYSNNPYSAASLKTINDVATVYTYGMDLTKTNKDGSQKLGGAVFTVEKKVGDTWSQVRFVADSEGVYHRVTTGGVTKITSGNTTEKLGKLDLRGLDVGTYRIKETQAPTGGYVVLKDYVTIKIIDTVDKDGTKNTIDGILDDGVANSTDAANVKGYIARSIPNSMGFDLPLTGGMGTILFTAGGIVLVAGAVVLLLVANRKKSRRG